MNEIITVNYDSEQPTVLGRDLHEALEIKTEYKKWFSRMCEYGFDENVDFIKVTQKCLTSSTGQNITDHQLTIPMAKEICMLQRSEKGKMCRQYFIGIEEKWNTPEVVMARALQMANRKLDEVRNTNMLLEERVNTLLEDNNTLLESNNTLLESNEELTTSNKVFVTNVNTWDYKSILNSLVRVYAMTCFSGRFGQAWNDYFKQLKYKYHIDLKKRKVSSEVKGNEAIIDLLREDEISDAVRMIVAICEENGINTGKIIKKVNSEKYA